MYVENPLMFCSFQSLSDFKTEADWKCFVRKVIRRFVHLCVCVRVCVRVLIPMHILSGGIHSTSFVEEYSIHETEVLRKYGGVLRAT